MTGRYEWTCACGSSASTDDIELLMRIIAAHPHDPPRRFFRRRVEQMTQGPGELR